MCKNSKASQITSKRVRSREEESRKNIDMSDYYDEIGTEDIDDEYPQYMKEENMYEFLACRLESHTA